MLRTKTIVPILGWLFCLVILLPTLVTRTERGDLGLILEAAARLEVGLPLYDLTHLNEHTKAPMATLLFLPLTKFPTFWVERLWDVAVISSWLLISLVFSKVLIQRHSVGISSLFLLGLLFTLNNWNSELRGGQVNALLLAFVLMSALPLPSVISGCLFAVALIVKPTYLIFLPWVIVHSKRKLPFLSSAAAMVIALSLIYGLVFGFERLLLDHLAWRNFLPLSVDKHLLRLDNYGIPTQLAHVGLNFLIPWVGALSLVIGSCLAFARDKWLSFALIAPWLVFGSPMAWMQNFVVVLPLVLFASAELLDDPKHSQVAVTCLTLIYLGLQVCNPTVLGTPFGELYVKSSYLPFWTVLLATMTYSSLRLKPASFRIPTASRVEPDPV